MRLTLGFAPKYGSLNSDMVIPRRTKLRPAQNSTNGFVEWFNCGEYSTILRSRRGVFLPFPRPLSQSIGGNLPTAPSGGLQERKHFGAMQNPSCDRSSRRFWNQMMPTGTVTSFNWSKGYGFIKTEGGA